MFGVILYPFFLCGLFFGPVYMILDFGVEGVFMFFGALVVFGLNVVWGNYDRASRKKGSSDTTPYFLKNGQTVPTHQYYMHYPELFWARFDYDFLQTVLLRIPGFVYVAGMVIIGIGKLNG